MNWLAPLRKRPAAGAPAPEPAIRYYSHIGQDRWVAEIYGAKRGGYFLDFGALDGVLTSNTYALEQSFGWTGLIVEANPTHFPAVCRSRSSVAINAALWGESRKLLEMVDAHGLSSALEYRNADSLGELRASITTRTFTIDTINPTELLRRHNAPRFIEYMSLDVEGAELDVLSGFDFEQFTPGLVTIEHSEIEEKRDAIRRVMLPLGYEVVQRHYDDWFWRPDVVRSLDGKVDPLEVFRRVSETYVIENP